MTGRRPPLASVPQVSTSLLPVACLLLLTAATAAQAPAPQARTSKDTTPTFRSGVEYVDVDVTVVDRKGRPVRGLGRHEFEIYEDGVLQTLDSFRQVDIPLPPRPAGNATSSKFQAPSDVTSNRADGRVYVMLLDGTGGAPLLRTRLAARRFVTDALGPDDLMAVIVVNSMMSHSHGFTSDKARLLSVIDRFDGSRWEGMNDALVDISERSSATGDAYTLIRQLAERLGDIPGRRKSILWVGGAPLFHHTDLRQAAEAFAQRDAIRAANRNNVAIYPIDPHGLTGAMGLSELERQAGFRVMAEDTGGEAVVNTNNFSGNYRRIVELNSAFYVLGYVPQAAADAGQFHRIKVKVKRPGLSVRTRTGYRSPVPDTEIDTDTRTLLPLTLLDGTRTALRSPLPVSGLALNMFLAPFKGDGDDGTVLIGAQLDADHLRLNGGEEIEIAQMALDTDGRVLGESATRFTLNLREHDPATAGGLRYYDRLELPAGRHEIRLVVHQPGGLTGSLVGHVEVPNFTKKAVTISGLVVASLNDPSGRTLRSDASVQEALTAQPTINRQFTPDDTLSVWAQLYDNRHDARSTMPVTSRIVAQSGAVVTTRSRVLPAVGDPLSPQFEFRERFELSGLAPGEYVLQVATEVAGKKKNSKTNVVRALPFTVLSE